jgi:hypothetical protein
MSCIRDARRLTESNFGFETRRHRSWGEVVTAPDWHDELVLVAELASVNNQIARFVLRLLDADAGRREQVATGDEYCLGSRLVDLGHALQNRAAHRETGRSVGRGAGRTAEGGGTLDDCVNLRPRPHASDKMLSQIGCGNR